MFNTFPATYDGEIIPYVHEFTVLLPINETGDKLPLQSRIVACLSYRELHALKSLGHTFWPLSDVQVYECFVKIPVRILLDVLFRVFRFS